MSYEIINDLMDTLKSSHKPEFSGILQEALDYGFIEDVEMSELFDIDLVELEEILEDSSNLTNKEWNFKVNKLYKFLKKQKSQYEVLYYRD